MEDQNAARAAIVARIDALTRAWNSHDAAAFTAPFAEDVDFTNVFGITLHGRAAITASHEKIFNGMFSESRHEVTDLHVRFLSDDIAAVDARWTMTGARDPQGNPWPKRHGLMSMIATRKDGAWWFTVFHNQDLMPPDKIQEIRAKLGQ